MLIVTQHETRTKLIQAAGEVFGELGYEAATVRDISTRAGANVAAVNYHFRDKLGLYTETLKTSVFARSIHETKTPFTQLPPEQALRLFITEMFSQMFNPAHPAWYSKVMAHELAQPTPGMAVVVEQVIRPLMLTLCEIIGRILEIAPTDLQSRLCANSIIGQIVHYVNGRPVIGLLWPDWEPTPSTLNSTSEHITQFSLEAMKGIRRANARAGR